MDGGQGSSAHKSAEHEEAAHQKRNWVRLTYDCNDRCIFCLDAHTHDGTNRAREEIRDQILDGRKKGAQRLILSGGEPTIHPNFPDFVRLGRAAGYEKIQTVTNGRMFAYPEFLRQCVDAGLSEITFSIHGPNAKVHDALVGTKGAFVQEVEGLQNALDDGRLIVNIDVCVNRGNVKVLPEILATFTAMGVREYDLLHVIPFGRAYTEGKETLFYDLEEMRPHLLEAFAYSKRPDMHIWLNRFPPQHLEGFEHLIQDPYKLGDEVRGRKEEYAYLLEDGVPLDCREPARCKHCYLEPLCDTLDEVRETVASAGFERIRVDVDWEASLPPVYGGDPASAQRAKTRPGALALADRDGNQVAAEAAAASIAEGGTPRRRLPVLGAGQKPSYRTVPDLVRAAAAGTIWLVARDLAAARRELLRLAQEGNAFERLELELENYDALLRAGPVARVEGIALERVVVRRPADAAAFLSWPKLETCVELTRECESFLRGLETAPAGLVLRQPTYARMTTAATADVDLEEFFAAFSHEVPVENVPACVLGRPERETPATLDSAMLDPRGHLEIFRYAKRYVLDRFFTKSLRCRECSADESCRGMHINAVRAHGYGLMSPLP